MFKTNYHTHSNFSDGSGSIEDYIKSAITRGFNSLGFSDHAPLPFGNDWTITNADLSLYIDELKRLKEVYKDKIIIKSGLEIDYIENLTSPLSKQFKDLKLDYIIGSVHLLKDKKTGEYLGIDYKKNEIEQLIRETFEGDPKLLVKEYYKTIRCMSNTGGFDIIGHLDVIKKTNIDSIYFNETEDWYKEEIHMTLQSIKKNRQIVEINTGNIIKDQSRIYPSPWILNLAKTYDIPVMLNSDAHRPDRIDNFYKEAKAMIIDAGYTEVSILNGNKWINDKIT